MKKRPLIILIGIIFLIILIAVWFASGKDIQTGMFILYLCVLTLINFKGEKNEVD